MNSEKIEIVVFMAMAILFFADAAKQSGDVTDPIVCFKECEGERKCEFASFFAKLKCEVGCDRKCALASSRLLAPSPFHRPFLGVIN